MESFLQRHADSVTGVLMMGCTASPNAASD